MHYIYIYIYKVGMRVMKSWKQQNPAKQELYGYLPPSKLDEQNMLDTAGEVRRSKDELISDILLLTPSHGRTGVGQPARTYL